MNRRQGGEDFYFIQKVSQRGFFSECNSTRVIASPRPSTRVPFGTGPVVKRLTGGSDLLATCHPVPFLMLRDLFEGLQIFYPGKNHDQFLESQPRVLLDFLEGQHFNQALHEIRKNSGSPAASRKRFWRWFNMFRIMKFLHYARDHGYPDLPAGVAALQFLRQLRPEGIEIPPDSSDLKNMLLIFRRMDRSGMP